MFGTQRLVPRHIGLWWAEISFRWFDNAVWWLESSLRSPPPPVPLTGGGVLPTTGHYRTLPPPPLQSPALHCASATRIAGPASMRGCGFGGDDCASCWWSLARRRCESGVDSIRLLRVGVGVGSCRQNAATSPRPPEARRRQASLRSPASSGPHAEQAEHRVEKLAAAPPRKIWNCGFRVC